MLSLGDTFFHALTPEMQSDLLQNKFVMPLASRGLKKSEQLGALNAVRTATTRSHERSFLAHKTIAKQVEASLVRSNLGVSSSHNTSTGYEALQNDIGYSDYTVDNSSSVGHDSCSETHTEKIRQQQS